MARVTAEEIKQINELYLIYHTYSDVAKKVGRAPTTVKKYIDPNYSKPKEDFELNEINWEKLKKASPIKLTSELCILRKEEVRG